MPSNLAASVITIIRIFSFKGSIVHFSSRLSYKVSIEFKYSESDIEPPKQNDFLELRRTLPANRRASLREGAGSTYSHLLSSAHKYSEVTNLFLHQLQSVHSTFHLKRASLANETFNELFTVSIVVQREEFSDVLILMIDPSSSSTNVELPIDLKNAWVRGPFSVKLNFFFLPVLRLNLIMGSVSSLPSLLLSLSRLS